MSLSLAFLGTFAAKRGERALTQFRSINAQGLLVYLSLQAERAFAREVLATLFWPEEPGSTAKRNLRQTLYQLRQVLDDGDDLQQPCLLVTRHTIQFNKACDHTLDVAGFLQALQNGDLTNAAAAYGGELLPGFTCDSLAFEEWLRGERERLHRLALEALATLASRHLRNGHVAQAQTRARRQLALEPWSEVGHRQLMEALALAGQRSAALAQFVQCSEVLQEELGIDPSPETLALAERIANDELPPLDASLIAGRYVLEEELARSARGIVYRGRDNRTGERAAIKMLDAERTAGDPTLLERFLREGEILRQLDHPNIVKLLALDERDGHHYLVMEYVAGGDLRRLLDEDGALPLSRALSIALDLADALTRAHRLDILHRDLKPANVLLDDEGLAHLSDFGIARLGTASQVTEHGAVLGTLAYLSPEACMGQELDERADIWSFGVLLYEMLTGERPYGGAAAAVIGHILNDPLPDIRQRHPHIPEALEDLLFRLLAKNRTDRIPSVRLVGAELEAILRQAPALDQPQEDAAPSRRPHAFDTPTPERRQRARHNLPAQLTPFVGRESELAELQRLVRRPATRLVTIVGPGGMGKTRLALEAAERLVEGTLATQLAFPHGVFLVELAALGSREETLEAVATALGFALDRELEPLQQVLNFLTNKRLLLLLDNIEHLLAAPADGAELVSAFLRAAPGVKILVTSRQHLALTAENIFMLHGLAFPEWQAINEALDFGAVQLFAQGAQRARVDFQLADKDLPVVAHICRLAQGMPLGIMLAAAWIDTLSLDEIAQEMQADVDFLAREMSDLPPRQRSMRAVFDTSWALLSKAEQQILARLSVFRGGFTREAAQSVTGATLRQLLALVQQSLLQRDVVSGRFSLHDLLRALAAEKLAAQDVADSATAHSRAFLAWLASHEDGLQRHRQVETVHILRADDQNIQAAVRWAAQQGDAGLLLQALPALSIYFMICGRMADAARLYREILQLLPAGDDTFRDSTDEVTFLRASLLNRLQDIGFEEDDMGRPIDIDLLHAFFRSRGARLEEALVCQHLAHRAIRDQDFEHGLAHFRRQAQICEREGDDFRLPLSLARMGVLLFFAGEVEEGLRVGRRATALAEVSKNHLHTPVGLYLSAVYALFAKNDLEAAREQIQALTAQAYEHWSNGLNAIGLLGGLAYHGTIALLQGQLEEAQQFRQKMEEIAAVRNDPRDKLRMEAFAGLIDVTRGKHEAVNLQALSTTEGGVLNFGPIGLALTAYARGDRPLAARTIVEAWSVPITLCWPAILLQFIPVAASLLADDEQYTRAAALMVMARAHPHCPHGWWEIIALVHELDARLQSALSAEAYAAAQAQGRELDVRDAAMALLEELEAFAAASE